MITALEALLMEEQEALGRPPRNDIEELLPYMKHEPFTYYLNWKSPVIHPQRGQDQVTHEVILKSKLAMEVMLQRGLRRIEQRHNVVIPEDVVKEYVDGLARRILDYVEANIPNVEQAYRQRIDLARKGRRTTDDFYRAPVNIIGFLVANIRNAYPK